MSQSSVFSKFDDLNKLGPKVKQSIKFLYIFDDRNEKLPHDLIGKNVLFVTDEDKTFVFGRNTLNCLGLNNKEFIREPYLNRELSNKGINKFNNGCHHVIARNDHQSIFTWGYNKFGQLGRGTIDPTSFEPEKNEFLSKKSIVDISCGDWHTLALTSSGEVYAWGRNTFGQVGDSSNESTSVAEPVKLEGFFGHKIAFISCGSTHSLALSEEGKVFSWGSNINGQLGVGGVENKNFPEIIDFQNIVITKISCGQNYSLHLSDDGCIYAFGKGYSEVSKKTLIFSKSKIVEKLPSKLTCDVGFTDIVSVLSHSTSLAFSEDNLCYELGKINETKVGSPRKTEIESFFDYFTKKWQITQTTVHIQNGIPTNEKPHFSNHHPSEKNQLFNKSINENSQNKIIKKIVQAELPTTEHSNVEENVKKFSNDGKYENDFEEKSEIGSGGFGVVYKVRSNIDKQFYAIKKINLKGKSDKDKADAGKELQLMAKLKSECVVQYQTSWFEYTDTLFIQMELCMFTLEDVLSEKQVQFNRKENDVIGSVECLFGCEIFKEIAECLYYLHNLSTPIIHRDLKPGNILIANDNINNNKRFIKIGDFGLAKFHSYEEEIHTKDLGSSGYIAPEVTRNGNYDTSADIFSFGVITQAVFDIDINSSHKLNFSENSISQTKREAIENLIIGMMQQKRFYRPKAEKLIDSINSIKPTYEEIQRDPKSIDISNNQKTIEENFYLFFLRSKWQSYMRKSLC